MILLRVVTITTDVGIGFLYDTPGIDPLVLLVASAVLCFVALLMCYLPAQKASQVDPMVALRYA